MDRQSPIVEDTLIAVPTTIKIFEQFLENRKFHLQNFAFVDTMRCSRKYGSLPILLSKITGSRQILARNSCVRRVNDNTRWMAVFSVLRSVQTLGRYSVWGCFRSYFRRNVLFGLDFQRVILGNRDESSG